MNTVANMLNLLNDAVDGNRNLSRSAASKYSQVMEMNHHELREQNHKLADSVANINLSNYSLVVCLERTIAVLSAA
jgi:hypothetical protein